MSPCHDIRTHLLHLCRRRSTIFFIVLLSIVLFPPLYFKPVYAASLTLQLPNKVYTNRTLSVSWNADSKVSTFNLAAANRPDMGSSFLVAQRLAGTSSSYSLTLDASVGYRYFQLQAYDAGGNRLGTSNVVGVAKYATGVLLPMTMDSSLTGQYANYSDTCYNTPGWFISNNSTTSVYSIAKNFQLSEFFHGETYLNGVVDPIMVQHVQNIRSDWGAALTVKSGFRTPAHNASLSGAATCSSHTFGQAVDLAVDSYNMWLTLKGYAQQEGANYIEPWQADAPHLHADWRIFYQNPPYTNW